MLGSLTLSGKIYCIIDWDPLICLYQSHARLLRIISLLDIIRGGDIVEIVILIVSTLHYSIFPRLETILIYVCDFPYISSFSSPGIAPLNLNPRFDGINTNNSLEITYAMINVFHRSLLLCKREG